MKLKADETIIATYNLDDDCWPALRRQLSMCDTLRMRVADMIVDIYESLEERRASIWDIMAKKAGCADYADWEAEADATGQRLVIDQVGRQLCVVGKKESCAKKT